MNCKKFYMLFLIICCFCQQTVIAQGDSASFRKHKWAVGTNCIYMSNTDAYCSNIFCPSISITHLYSDKFSFEVDISLYNFKKSGTSQNLVFFNYQPMPDSSRNATFKSSYFSAKDFIAYFVLNYRYSFFKTKILSTYIGNGICLMYNDNKFDTGEIHTDKTISEQRNSKGVGGYTKYSLGCEIGISKNIALNIEPAIIVRFYNWGDIGVAYSFRGKAGIQYRF